MQTQGNTRVNGNANANANASTRSTQGMEVFSFSCTCLSIHSCKPGQRKRQCKRKVNTSAPFAILKKKKFRLRLRILLSRLAFGSHVCTRLNTTRQYSQLSINVFWFWHSVSAFKPVGNFTAVYSWIRTAT